MEKKNIPLSAISVDVEIQPDNTLDVYISTEGSSGAHYQNVSAEAVGENVQDLIECLAEAALEDTDRCLVESKKQEGMRGVSAPMRMILLYCRDYFKEHGYAPTLREIGDHTGLESTASVKRYMDKLYNIGMIESEHRGFPRAFRISKKGLLFLNS